MPPSTPKPTSLKLAWIALLTLYQFVANRWKAIVGTLTATITLVTTIVLMLWTYALHPAAREIALNHQNAAQIVATTQAVAAISADVVARAEARDVQVQSVTAAQESATAALSITNANLTATNQRLADLKDSVNENINALREDVRVLIRQTQAKAEQDTAFRLTLQNGARMGPPSPGVSQ